FCEAQSDAHSELTPNFAAQAAANLLFDQMNSIKVTCVGRYAKKLLDSSGFVRYASCNQSVL
ncbi:hypothetical protein, partial [Lapidilactobacillus luobeiensis]|uniref:hypothetical protein n=1 Tax=Lapidilactobacillus luobeiensis TaxID=2950371 RepID=UPI0021C3655C